MIKTLLTFFLTLIIFEINYSSQQLIVSKSSEYKTIKSAIDAAEAGDTILVEKGLAKKTIESYSRDIVRFLLYIQDHGIDAIADIDTRVILQYTFY